MQFSNCMVVIRELQLKVLHSLSMFLYADEMQEAWKLSWDYNPMTITPIIDTLHDGATKTPLF
ncbi:hypothetical protein [uncultured Flavobacterium sp.]|uniref:hypothetical protein n=1 Tax=uncultured Flavobacterium sp. TaxID=165435 RepID=UPI0025DDD3EA|nr:hypothetical protein [uncultured Flavobacterium sp.]